MKNVLSYYYNLSSESIRLNGENYYFEVNNENYVFYLYNGEIQDLNKVYNIYIKVIQMGIYTHQIILNKEHNIATQYNNKQYILLKLYHDLSRKVDIQDILYFGNVTCQFENINNWKQLWSNKIDYFEYQISQIGKKYPLIRESFSYYVGIVENGISLLNNRMEITCSIAHKRIEKGYNLFDFYNPLNYTIDTKVRDASEFFKNKMLEQEDVFFEIKEYLEKSNITEVEAYYFFVRMFYPTFYFDCYEKIIHQELEEYKIKEVIEITPRYEKLLKELYQYLKKFIKIPEIEWLNSI